MRSEDIIYKLLERAEWERLCALDALPVCGRKRN